MIDNSLERVLSGHNSIAGSMSEKKLPASITPAVKPMQMQLSFNFGLRRKKTAPAPTMVHMVVMVMAMQR